MLIPSYLMSQFTRCLLKGVLAYVPFLGPSFYFTEYIFLSRNWCVLVQIVFVGFGWCCFDFTLMCRNADQVKLKKSYRTIADTALPYLVCATHFKYHWMEALR